MELNAGTVDREEWKGRIAQAVKSAFWGVGITPDADNVAFATQELRRRLLSPKWHEEGRRFEAEYALGRLARFSVLTTVAEANEPRYGGGWEQTTDEALALVKDPFYGGSLLRLFGDHDEMLRSAPYEVQFTHASAETQRYRNNPYALPSFRIVDRSFAAYRCDWTNGQRKGVTHEQTTYHSHAMLTEHKERYAECLRRALPGYMRWLGLSSLGDKDRNVVTLIKREHFDDVEIKRRLRIPHSSYSDLMARLSRRGYEETLDSEGRRVLEYNPVLDSTQRFMDKVARDRILALSIPDLIADSDRLFAQVADTKTLTPTGVAHLARVQRSELLMARAGLEEIERHDHRLRDFIKVSIEKPVIGKGISLKEVEEILARMSWAKAKELVFRSLRYQRPVSELISMERLLAG